MSSQLPATRTPVSQADLYAALRAQWIALWGSPPSRGSLLVLVAQWALETGRGAQCMCWNLGNIRWTAGYPSDWCEFPTTEVIDGATVHVVGRFRAFASLEDGARDYLATLRGRFSRAWDCVLMGAPISFALACKRAGYFTADEQEYATALNELYFEFSRTLPDLETEVDTSDASILKG